MNLYDEYNRYQELQKQMDPLRHIKQSQSLTIVEEEYRRKLGTLHLVEPELAHRSDIQRYRKLIEDEQRWSKFAGVSSAAETAIELFRRQTHFVDAFATPKIDRTAREILDSYQRATAWLDPLRAIAPVENRLSELEKYRSLIHLADPLRLYRESMEAMSSAPLWGLTQQARGIFDALEAVRRDIGIVAGVTNDLSPGDEEFSEDDVERLTVLVNPDPIIVSLSQESIVRFVQEWTTAYEKLPSVRDKKIFATYIYPLLLALTFAMINPYSDFIVKQKLEAADKSSAKAVKSAVRESGVQEHVIENFRFVNAQKLNVRMNGKIRSPIVGSIGFGQPVEILKKDGDWTLVHYSNSENDTMIQGWVLSRYLKRYK